MSIYINKNNQQSGPFEEARVQEMLNNKEISPNDWGFRKGAKEWQPLQILFPTPTVQNIPEATEPMLYAKKSFNKWRWIFGALFILSFAGFHLLMLLIAFSMPLNMENLTLLFGWAVICLIICAILLVSLAFGVGANNGMSQVRTPLLCSLILLWCFGVGGIVLYSTQRMMSGEEFLSELKRLGVKENSADYQNAMKAVDRENKVKQGAFGLFGLGTLSAIGAVGSIVVVGRMNNVAAKK